MASLTKSLDSGYGGGSDNGAGNANGCGFGEKRSASAGEGFHDGDGYGCGLFDCDGRGYGDGAGNTRCKGYSDGCGQVCDGEPDSYGQGQGDAAGCGSGNGKEYGFGEVARHADDDELTIAVFPGLELEHESMTKLIKSFRACVSRLHCYTAAPEVIISHERRLIDKRRAALRSKGVTERQIATWESPEYSDDEDDDGGDNDGSADAAGCGHGSGDSAGSGHSAGRAEGQLKGGEIPYLEEEPIAELLKSLRGRIARRNKLERMEAPEHLIANEQRSIEEYCAALRARGASEDQIGHMFLFAAIFD